ncbi:MULTISPECIES: hypothetical protein [unclassified Synechococcus]|uniref:hypothetical protein n=1 Tax=unclassified Synechococcus TaxID=2626047 RepID=UPI0037D99C6D
MVSAEKGWGFHEHAKKLNGRQAMLGFITLLITEFAKAVKSLPATSWELVDPAARSVPAGFLAP